MKQQHFETKKLSSVKDTDAPDRSEIRLLLATEKGSTCHCVLPPGRTSLAGVHRSVEEIWYCIQGLGQVWRRQGEDEAVVDVSPGLCLTIPAHTQFQFRNTGWEPLVFLLTTMPPWPGEQEWSRVREYWPVE